MAEDFDPFNAREPEPKRQGQKPPKGTQTGKRAIKAHFQAASRELEDSAAVLDPDPHEQRNDIRPGKWPGFPHDSLPPDCPVDVIGRDIAGKVWVKTATNDLFCIEKFDHPALVGIFAPHVNFLYWAWPGWSKEKKDEATGELIPPRINRVERDKAATAIINAAAKRPLFDPAAQHRGRGGWKDKSGRFLWHSGTWLWTVTNGKLTRSKPLEHEGYLYTRQPATIEPWDMPVTIDESPAQRILGHLQTWNWERPYLDPLLCLGWIGVALLGGALKVRPIIFTTGGAGVGKSTLHELFKHVLQGVVLTFADTTAAGIYQRVKQDSLPVMVDELENKPGSGKATAIIDLARIAYSGADMGRGGADHEAVGFKLLLAFLFSAINPPHMTEADRSRMAILNLSRLDKAERLAMEVKEETDGRMLLRRLMDGWPDFNSKLLPMWWDTLQAQGLDSRAIDTFGTLLAVAELLVGAAAMQDCGLPVGEADKLGPVIAEATRVERSERLDNWHKCLNHLLDCSIDAWREGVRPTVGTVMEKLTIPGTEGMDLKPAQERLQLVGLTARDDKANPGRFLLAIPRDGPQLRKLFDGSDWDKGGWWQALKQAPKEVVLHGQTAKINGKPTHCSYVDMPAFAAWVEKQARDAGGAGAQGKDQAGQSGGL